MGRMFEKRKHTMRRRWDRMAKAFTRAGKEIAIAVKEGGGDPDANPALRRAIQNARGVNMPKDKIQGAIDKALGVGATDYEIINYEGYGPHGIAILVVAATDNPTRTVSNLRLHFKKEGGNLGNAGTVAYLFEKQGVFKLDPEGIDRDDLMLEMIDHGLEGMEDGENDDGDPLLVLRCSFEDFGSLQSALEDKGIETKSSGVEYVPSNTMALDEDAEGEVLALIDRLEEDDDVQDVYHTLA